MTLIPYENISGTRVKPLYFADVWALHYKLTWEELVRLYRLTARNAQARHNVCPTDRRHDR
jgi:hypothetical protein